MSGKELVVSIVRRFKNLRLAGVDLECTRSGSRALSSGMAGQCP